MNNLATVYWLKTAEHTDHFSEGYVGVTVKSPRERYNQHKNASKRGSQLPVHKAIRKYGDLDVVILIEGDEEFCYLVEKALRPTANVGYNVAPGGDISPTTGTVCTEETKQKISKANKGNTGLRGAANPMYGRSHSDESKAKHRNTWESKKEWEKHNVNRQVWALAAEIESWLTVRERRGFKGLAIDFGFKPDQVKIIHKKIKEGWIPSQDVGWVLFKAAYTEDYSEHLLRYKQSLQSWEDCGGKPQKGNKPSVESLAKQAAWRATQEFHPWNNPACKYETWLKAEEAYMYIQANPTHRQKKLGDALGLGLGAVASLFNRLISGWIPSEDPAYLSWLEQYKQKEAEKCQNIASYG